MSAPSAVPALKDMPLTESVPVCEFEWVETGRCWHAATVRLRTHIWKVATTTDADG